MKNNTLQLIVLCFSLLAIRTAATTYYVDINSSGPTPPYTSWSTAATNIQDAVDAANAGDTVLVTNGNYQTGGSVIPYGASLNRVAVTKPLTVISVNGPAGTTILGYVYPYYPEGARCAYVTNGALLSGFTLSSGNVEFGTNQYDNYDFNGGGVYAESEGVISNCIVTNNMASYAGGGAFGGLLIDSIISGNSCVSTPGASGGGAAGSGLVNCILSHNLGYQGGATWGCSLTNCTVVTNSADRTAGGVGGSTVINSIIYLNTDPQGTDNTNDPSFVNMGNNDFHLQANSPCINAGSNAYVTTLTDLDGNPRIVGGIVDLGAYEYQAATIAITAQPQPAVQTNILGQTLVLNVDAVSPFPLSYQWLFDSNGIAGATNSSLVISNLQLTDTGYYSVVISNSFFATNSSAAFLSVIYPPPAIVQQPTNLAVILGSNTMLSITATSFLNMTFRWQLNGTNLTDQGEFSGSASSNLLISGAVAADAGNYDVIVSDSEWSVTSAVATVSILFPATISLQPTNETAVVPNNVSLSAAASGTGPLGFQWFFNGTALTDGGNISGSTSSNLDISGVQLTNAGVYQLLVTNSFSEVLSATSTLTVLARAQILTEPTNEAVLIGSPATISVAAAGTSLGYQWYFNGEPLSDGNGIVGSGSANLTITDVQSANGGNYQLTVSNAVSFVSSTVATLTPLTSPGPSIRYVNVSNSAPASPYLTWSIAATNIQNDIDASISGDTIVVTDGVYQAGGEIAPGNYVSNRVVISKPLTVQSVNGPGSTFILGVSVPETGYNPQAMRCVFMTTNVTLMGFTLADGATLYGTSTASDAQGGGVWCASTNNDIISNCVITANAAYNQGGGVYQGTLLNCTVLGNQAAYGGGIANALVFRSLIISNVANTGIQYNEPEGGGTYHCAVFSSALAANSAGYDGGGASGGTLVNCTVTYNSAFLYGGGVSFCIATNSIIYHNQIFSNNTGETNSDGTSLNYCCTTPNAGGANITTPPDLANLSHIGLNSPCKGAGNPAMSSGTDIDGNPWGNPPSIGCSEIPSSGDYGNLTVNISTAFTNWAPGYPLNFQATISGPVYTTVWNFGDGTILTNAPYLSHLWVSTGIYPVTLTAFNDSYPTGVTATVMMSVALPTNYYVNLVNPNPVPPYSYWSTAATNIQDAVNVATPGSTVLVTNPTVIIPGGDGPNKTNYVAIYQYGGTTVKEGQYIYSYRVGITNPITLQSVNGPAVTYINGAQTANGSGGLYLTDGVNLSGFTITNGWIFSTSTNATITNCIITHCENEAQSGGGGAYSGTFYNCTFTANTGFPYGGAALMSVLNNCLISNNSAGYGGGVCGGIANNCVIVTNTATSAGGGGVYANPSYPTVLNNCLVSNNIARSVDGGGVFNLTQSTPGYYTNCILNNCILTRNFTTRYGGGAYGAELNNCLICSNTAGVGGGVEGGLLDNCILIGNSNDAADGSSIYPAEAVLTNCMLVGNRGFGAAATRCALYQCTLLQNVGRGGGGANSSILNDCLIISNVATPSGPPSEGGGALSCELTNCFLALNAATNGGGAYASILVNCTVTGNTAVNGGGVFNCTNFNSILYYNINGDFSPNTTQYPLNYCCVSLPATNGIRNITNPPLFVNLAGGDYHLQSSSPCVNSGNTAYITAATDLDGNPRVQGGTVDIGAYEYQTPTSVISYAYLQQYGLPTDGSVDFKNLDGTAFDVYQDWIAGLNPTNPASVLAMLTPVATNTATGVTVTWQSVSGIPYFLQRSTNLASQPPFSIIQSNIIGQTNTTSYTDTSATNGVPYFYRVGVVGP
jgi:hypothetical protein